MGSGNGARLRRAVNFVVVRIPRFILGSLILVGIGINFANVVGRYVFSKPIIWAEEILVYIMIWCVGVGAILVTWEGRHIKMDLVAVRLPRPWNRVVNGVVAVCFVLVCVFILRQSWTVISMMFQTGQQSVIARLPMGFMHSAITFGFAGMLLAVLARFRSYVNGEFGSDIEAATREVVQTYGTAAEEEEDADARG